MITYLYENSYLYIMKELNVSSIISALLILLVISATGCVAPPKAGSSTPGTGGASPTVSKTTPSYVTEVTPYITTTTIGTGYHILTPLDAPKDSYCLINNTKSQYYAYNKTAFTFDLKNPPMFINYTLTPFNLTGTRTIPGKLTGESSKTVSYDYYSPVSWFEVTVRNKTSGEIYLQDGFGARKGYPEYTNRTLKIPNRADLYIEFYGNNITAGTMTWVKPAGNFNDTTEFNLTRCAYFDRPRDIIFSTTAPTTAPSYGHY